MMLETTTGNSGGRHGKTASYGRPSSSYSSQYLALSPRDALAYDLRDLKNVLKEQGLYNKKAREKIKEFINKQEQHEYTSDVKKTSSPSFTGTTTNKEKIFSKNYIANQRNTANNDPTHNQKNTEQKQNCKGSV